MNQPRLQARILVSSRSLESRQEDFAKDGISGSVKEHHCLEALQVVDRIDHPIIALQLRSLEMSEWRMHDLVIKRWVIVEFITLHQLVTNCLDLLVQLLRFLLDFRI